MKISRYFLTVANQQPEPHYRVAAYSLRTGKFFFLEDPNTTQALLSGNWTAIERDTRMTLIDFEVLVPQDEDEVSFILARNEAAAEDDSRLLALVQSTTQYLLANGRHDRIDFTARGQDQATDLLLRHLRKTLSIPPAYTELEIGWLDTEETRLDLRLIRELSPQLRQAASDAGCQYRSRLITRGRGLTDDIATELIAEHSVLSVEFLIGSDLATPDGQRDASADCPTFARTYQNLAALARSEHQISITVRCEVDRANYPNVKPLIRRLQADGLAERIIFQAVPRHPWGKDKNENALSLEEFAQLEIGCLELLMRAGFKFSLLPASHGFAGIARRSNGGVIDLDGPISGNHLISYVLSDANSLLITSAEYTKHRSALNESIMHSRYPCNTCRILPLCGGTYPEMWAEGAIPCPSAKANIESRLRLTLDYARPDHHSQQERSES